MSDFQSQYNLKSLILSPFWRIFSPKTPQNVNFVNICFYPVFRLYAAVSSYKKPPRKIQCIDLLQLKKILPGPLFAQKTHDFSKKTIWFNFNPFRNFMQKIRKAPCIDFSQNLKSLILGTFWPKNSIEKFLPKNYFVQF